MKKLVTLAVVTLLSVPLIACAGNEPLLITTQNKVVDIPPELYNCPTVKIIKGQFSTTDINQFTDQDVAKLIALYHRSNLTCRANMAAIKKFVDEAKRITNKK